MAVQYDNKAKNLMLDALGAVALRLALHTGDPGAADTAANEVTGGSPAYARKAIAWISGWNTAGTSRYFKKQVTSEAFGAQGTYTVTDADLDLNNDPA
jgi:hypothetical protein